MRRRRARGFSLIELIVAIVIIGVAVGGVLLVFTVAATHSADPLQYQQAIAIAEGYLDEILARRYDDPDGSDDGEDRTTFDDVSDYNGLDEEPPRTQDNVPVTDLKGYAVKVTVTPGEIGPTGKTVAAKRIDVRVTFPPLVDTTISAYKAEDE